MSVSQEGTPGMPRDDKGLGLSPPYVGRIWDICLFYCNMPKALFYLLKEDYEALRPFRNSMTQC